MVPSMHCFKALRSLLASALAAYASAYQEYSTWMLESIIARGEGISAADGLLGEIQKVYFSFNISSKLMQSLPC